MAEPNGDPPNSSRFSGRGGTYPAAGGVTSGAGGSPSRCGVSRPLNTCINSVGDMVGIGTVSWGALPSAPNWPGPEEARANIDLLARRVAVGFSAAFRDDWAELIDDVEVMADGRVLLAKLHGPHWTEVALDDTLLWHTGTEPAD